MRATTVISAGLFAAWTAHDLEELLTMSANSRQLAARAPAWLPIPDDVRRNGLPQEQVTLAIGLVGALTTAAAADGVRRSRRRWRQPPHAPHVTAQCARTRVNRHRHGARGVTRGA